MNQHNMRAASWLSFSFIAGISMIFTNTGNKLSVAAFAKNEKVKRGNQVASKGHCCESKGNSDPIDDIPEFQVVLKLANV